VIGIKYPAVDAMIERVVLAKSYDDLAAAAKRSTVPLMLSTGDRTYRHFG
jgi:hypothetical protein